MSFLQGILLLCIVGVWAALGIEQSDSAADASRDMVLVEGGEFTMGNPQTHLLYKSQQPLHRVRLKDFYINTYEVTNEQYRAFLQAYAQRLQVDTIDRVDESSVGLRYKEDILLEVITLPSSPVKSGIRLTSTLQAVPEFSLIKGKERYPVTYVTWYGARAYCEWKYKKGALPSEAQWEYAARGGKYEREENYQYLYAGSDSLAEVGWYWENAGFTPHRVGEKKPNLLGLYDMSGNLWEWIEDHWHEDYRGAPSNGRAWMDKKARKDHTRVLRGGAWLYHKSQATTTNRWKDVPDDRHKYKGFRCVCEK